jgi:hypothetical protein
MPIAWENNVLGFVPRTDWLDVNFNITRQGDPIDTLFGDQKTDNLVAEWESIASEYQIPVMAQFHGFDTEAQKTFRIPVDSHNIEKGLIKVKINQSERMRALIRAGVQGDERLYDYVINDGVRLAEQVVTRTKVAKNELLATGQVTIKENNLDLVVDYGVPAENKAFEINVAADADIPTQLQAVVDYAQSIGAIITGMVTSKKILGKLRSNAVLQKVINGVYMQGAQIRNTALRDYLSEEFGINTIITNDLTYGASSTIGADGRPVINAKRYYPQDKITFIAVNLSGTLGVGLWGDSPEVDLEQLQASVEAGVSPYVYITQWVENDPAVLWTKASTLFMPVLYNPKSLFIANTVEESTDASRD